MKVKLKRTGQIVEIKELIVDIPSCAAYQRESIEEVEFIPVEFIKYLTGDNHEN